MNKEIEEARAHKREREALDGYVREIAQQLQDRGLIYTLCVLHPKQPLSAFSAWGPTCRLADCLSLMTTAVTKMFSDEIRRQKARLKKADLDDGETWED